MTAYGIFWCVSRLLLTLCIFFRPRRINKMLPVASQIDTANNLLYECYKKRLTVSVKLINSGGKYIYNYDC